MKLERLEKKSFLTFFFQLKFFFFFFKFLKISYLDQNQKSHFFFKERIANFELGQLNKVLHGCSSTLEFFLVK